MCKSTHSQKALAALLIKLIVTHFLFNYNNSFLKINLKRQWLRKIWWRVERGSIIIEKFPSSLHKDIRFNLCRNIPTFLPHHLYTMLGAIVKGFPNKIAIKSFLYRKHSILIKSLNFCNHYTRSLTKRVFLSKWALWCFLSKKSVQRLYVKFFKMFALQVEKLNIFHKIPQMNSGIKYRAESDIDETSFETHSMIHKGHFSST